MECCPFCGCEKSYIINCLDESIPPKYFRRCCNNCGASVFEITEEKCNALWNKRVYKSENNYLNINDGEIIKFNDELEMTVSEQTSETLKGR